MTGQVRTTTEQGLLVKEGEYLSFSQLAQALYPFCGEGASTDAFVVTLIDNLMETPTTAADEQKAADGEYNPLGLLQANSLKKIYSGARQISTKNAAVIVNHLDKGKFQDYIHKLSTDAMLGLCAALQKVDIQTTPQDVSVICADMFAKVIIECAQSVKKPLNDLMLVPQQESSMVLGNSEYAEAMRTLYGSQLLLESKGFCLNKSCGESLTTIANGKPLVCYEPTKIAPDGPSDAFDNVIALCPKCSKSYIAAPTPEAEAQLTETKKSLLREAAAMEVASTVDIEPEIESVVRQIASINPTVDLIELNYTPANVMRKIHQDGLLMQKTIFNVTKYFNYVRELFQEQSKAGRLQFEIFAMQVRLCYRKESGTGLSQQEIYDALVEWLRAQTNGNRDACEVLISYFIQNCEVFDAVAE